jgi:hypothetical protein
MIGRRQFMAKAGSLVSLPFLLATAAFFQSGANSSAKEDAVPTFQEFESSCIDLGHYDSKKKELTVRFIGKKPERFYRYSDVPAEIWKKLNALNEKGGVGEYLNETVVQHPEKFPYEELTIQKFKTIPKKKKAGDSK